MAGMVEGPTQSVIDTIMAHMDALTPKGRILGNYILQYPRKAVFMTTKELAETTRVSEATVVRFVSQLGYEGYGDFLQALRDHVDTGLSLPERVELDFMTGPAGDRFHRIVLEEMNNLRQLYKHIDAEALSAFADRLQTAPSVCVVGSRISYTFAYYLGWSLTKVRKGVTLIKGSDSAAIDWLNNAPVESLVILFAISRYPTELIRLGKVARRLGHTLFVITDSALCPLIPFAHRHLVAPTKSFPLVGYATAISCVVDYLIQELAGRDGDELKKHQDRLEQIYRENDILFDMHTERLD
ncbi:MurR/RpiR family transcriptional regulator [uncultured Desulfosarcina sp.]|uniref:MurR/RpiR family transcriptional regulator n=1 Tax=uncultured Desulfosarcina sp. TaxID=218289 RepID=UPI0029C6ED92|nr:MurR/RpiR family transcriptional regulator [uncultured Desulfosarcina sp.]